MRRLPALVYAGALLLPSVTAGARAQQSIGSLRTEGAEITGLVTVKDGRATIGNSGAIHVGLQTSDVTLTRGGTVKVCTGSAAHLSQATLAVARPPLLIALDRGAVEVRTAAEKTDVVMTPDLRFELSDAAPLDLRIRVVPNGDTCVENAGKDAPMLHVTETFGTGAYFVRPGQRVLFEHGSLREVVDHEGSSCGCPRGDALVVAEKGKTRKPTEAERTNPFPEAVSQGLTAPPVPTTPASQPGEVHTQVSSMLNYSGATNTASGPPGQSTSATEIVVGGSAAPNTSSTTVPARTETPVPPVRTEVVSAAPPPSGPNPFRAIGHFFRRIFGGH